MKPLTQEELYKVKKEAARKSFLSALMDVFGAAIEEAVIEYRYGYGSFVKIEQPNFTIDIRPGGLANEIFVTVSCAGKTTNAHVIRFNEKTTDQLLVCRIYESFQEWIYVALKEQYK